MVDMVSRIKLLFVAQGASKVAKQTEQVGRAQTRLGQTSASTGRQFSAQASGLGGLVAAYAGAAATIFALTQAFAALNRAAQAEQVIAGTRALALEVGASGNQIIKNIQKITKGQLSMAEAAQSANIALSAGFNTEQIERLTAVSLKASRALGRTLTDALTRLTRGTAKLEPELLDELGIFVRIEPAVEAYASQLGKVASALTSFERRQAFVNATIEEGERKFGIINTSTETTLEGFEKLQATFQDLAREFGSLLADTLAPIARFFSDTLGNSLLLFLVVGRLVFGKAGQLMSGFFARQLQNLDRWSDKMTMAVAKTETFATASAKVGGAAISAKGQFTGPRAQAAGASAARERARQGDVSLRQMMKDKKALTGVKEAERSYRRAVRASNRSTATKNKLMADSRSRSLFAATAINRYTKAIKGASFGNRMFAASANVASMAIKGLSAVMSTLMSVMNVLFMVVGAAQLIGSFFDVDILGGIVGWFKKLGEETRAVKKGIEGVVNAISMDDSIREMLRRQFSEKEMEEIGKLAGTAITEGIAGAQLRQIRSGQIGAAAAVGTEQQALMEREVAGTFGAVETKKEAEFLVKTTQEVLNKEQLTFRGPVDIIGGEKYVIERMTEGLTYGNLQASAYVTTLQKLGVAQKELDVKRQVALGEQDTAGIIKLNQEIAAFNLALQTIEDGRFAFGRLGVELEELTGVPLGRLINSLHEANNTFIVGEKQVTYLGEAIAILDYDAGQFKMEGMFHEFKALIGVETRFMDLQKRVSDAYKRGAIDAQGMSQKVGGLQSLIKEYNTVLETSSEEHEELIKRMVAAQKPQEEQDAIFAAIKVRVDELTTSYKKLLTQAKELSVLENINKTMRKAFSGELKLFDEAAFKGVIGTERVEMGVPGKYKDVAKFAETQEEITANQKKFLSDQITGLKISKETQEELDKHGSSGAIISHYTEQNLDLNAKIRQELINADTAMKALIGGTAKMVLEAEKLRVSIEKMSDKLTQAKAIINMKEDVAATKREITKLNADLTRGNKILAESAKWRKVATDQVKQQIAHGKQVLEIEKLKLETAKRSAEVASEQSSAANALVLAQAKLSGGRIVGATQRELAAMERNENLRTAEEIRQKREELLKIELNQALYILRLEYQQQEDEAALRLGTLKNEKQGQQAILTEQKNRLTLEFTHALSVQNREAVNLNIKQTQEQNKAKNDILVLGKQKQLLKDEHALIVQGIRNRTETARLQAQKLVDEAKLLAEQAQTYIEGGVILAKVFNVFIAGVKAYTGADLAPIDVDALRDTSSALANIITKAGELEKGARGIMNQIRSNQYFELQSAYRNREAKEDARKADLRAARRILRSMQDRHQLEKNLAKEVTKDAKELLEKQIDSKQAEVDALDKLINNEETLASVRAANYQAQREAEIRNAQLQQDILDRQRESLTNFLNDISGKLQGRFKEGIDSLFKAMNEGTLTMENFREGFRAWIVNILGDLQQSLLDEFITKPITELIKKGMGSLKDWLMPDDKAVDTKQTLQEFIDQSDLKNISLAARQEAFAAAHIQQVWVVNAAEIGGGVGDSLISSKKPSWYLPENNTDIGTQVAASGDDPAGWQTNKKWIPKPDNFSYDWAKASPWGDPENPQPYTRGQLNMRKSWREGVGQEKFVEMQKEAGEWGPLQGFSGGQMTNLSESMVELHNTTEISTKQVQDFGRSFRDANDIIKTFTDRDKSTLTTAESAEIDQLIEGRTSAGAEVITEAYKNAATLFEDAATSGELATISQGDRYPELQKVAEAELNARLAEAKKVAELALNRDLQIKTEMARVIDTERRVFEDFEKKLQKADFTSQTGYMGEGLKTQKYMEVEAARQQFEALNVSLVTTKEAAAQMSIGVQGAGDAFDFSKLHAIEFGEEATQNWNVGATATWPSQTGYTGAGLGTQKYTEDVVSSVKGIQAPLLDLKEVISESATDWRDAISENLLGEAQYVNDLRGGEYGPGYRKKDYYSGPESPIADFSLNQRLKFYDPLYKQHPSSFEGGPYVGGDTIPDAIPDAIPDVEMLSRSLTDVANAAKTTSLVVDKTGLSIENVGNNFMDLGTTSDSFEKLTPAVIKVTDSAANAPPPLHETSEALITLTEVAVESARRLSDAALDQERPYDFDDKPKISEFDEYASDNNFSDKENAVLLKYADARARATNEDQAGAAAAADVAKTRASTTRKTEEQAFLTDKALTGIGIGAVATFGTIYAATGDFKKSMIATFLQMFTQIALMAAQSEMSGGSSGGSSGGGIGSFLSGFLSMGGGDAAGGAAGGAAIGGGAEFVPMAIAASGGAVTGSGMTIQKFAAGGGVMHRDRVPVLLEPGEFVIRKPMAKAIGGPALQRMNGTGQMSGGNVEVNLINKGTPQKAEAKEKPKFDGKGMVIEIVLTDLKNNGPIKQAIRGGGRR